MVGVAQLVRAPDCGSGSRGFKSRHPPHFLLLGQIARNHPPAVIEQDHAVGHVAHPKDEPPPILLSFQPSLWIESPTFRMHRPETTSREPGQRWKWPSQRRDRSSMTRNEQNVFSHEQTLPERRARAPRLHRVILRSSGECFHDRPFRSTPRKLLGIIATLVQGLIGEMAVDQT